MGVLTREETNAASLRSLAYAHTFSRPQIDFWNSPDIDQLNLLSETIVALVMVERRVPSDHNATVQTRSNASYFKMVRV